MEYRYFAELDYYDDYDEDQEMGERFEFKGSSQSYSYNQAIWMMGVHLRNLNFNEFEVQALEPKTGRNQNLYEGNNCYDWYMKIKADSLRKFERIDFYDKTNEERYILRRLSLDFKYRYLVKIPSKRY